MNNKKALLVVALFLMTLGSWIAPVKAAQGGDRIERMRSLNYTVVIKLLLYYNLRGSPYEDSNLEAASLGFKQLKDLSDQLGDAPISAQVLRLQESIANLKALPNSKDGPRTIFPAFSRWLLSVVDQSGDLEQQLSAIQKKQPGEANELESLRHDIQRLLYSYELASFQYLGADYWVLDEKTIEKLDKAVEQRFYSLMAKSPQDKELLDKAFREYQFVRKHILTSDGGQPTAVERYLSRVLQVLDGLIG